MRIRLWSGKKMCCKQLLPVINVMPAKGFVVQLSRCLSNMSTAVRRTSEISKVCCSLRRSYGQTSTLFLILKKAKGG